MIVLDRYGDKLGIENRYSGLKIEQEINVSDICFFDVPLSKGDLFQEEGYFEIEHGRFVIKEKNLSGDRYEIIGKYDLEELAKRMDNKAFTTMEIQEMLIDILPDDWAVINEESDRPKRTVTGTNITIIEMIYKIVDTFGYEVRFDNVLKTVTVAERLGKTKGVYFHNELNLEKLNIKSDTYDFVTRLIPKGYDGLGIETINEGIPYVDNFDYTDKIVFGYWEDKRYKDKEQLKRDAIDRVAKYSKPLRSYEVDILDLTNKPEYEHLTFNVGDVIELIDNVSRTREKQRIVKKTLFPEEFGNDKIVIENRPRYQNEEQENVIKDLTENYENIEASFDLFEDRIVGRVESLEVTVENMDGVAKEEPENPETGDLWLNQEDGILYRWDGSEWVAVGGVDEDRIFDRIRSNSTEIEQLNDQISATITSDEFNEYKNDTTQDIEYLESQLTATAEEWNLKFSKTVGSNRVKNSVGMDSRLIQKDNPFAEDEWEISQWNHQFEVSTRQSKELEKLGSGSSLVLKGYGRINQEIPLESNQIYTLSLLVKVAEKGPDVGVNVTIDEVVDGINQALIQEDISLDNEQGFIQLEYQFTTTSGDTKLSFMNSDDGAIEITNILINEGDIVHTWTPYPKEVYTTNFKADGKGLRVSRVEDGKDVGYTEMTPEEFAGYYKEEKVFKMNKDVFEMSNAKVENEVQIGKYRLVAMSNGIAIVPVR